ncbi:MAG TPA: hypothetical protein VG268_12200 [Streptosporangiaceae bacterium]|nr:hypothetical protein [Streptosporangiaceae bacterium]
MLGPRTPGLADGVETTSAGSAGSAVGAEELKRVLTTGQYDYLLGHEAELLELTPSDIRAKLTDVFHTCS